MRQDESGGSQSPHGGVGHGCYLHLVRAPFSHLIRAAIDLLPPWCGIASERPARTVRLFFERGADAYPNRLRLRWLVVRGLVRRFVLGGGLLATHSPADARIVRVFLPVG